MWMSAFIVAGIVSRAPIFPYFILYEISSISVSMAIWLAFLRNHPSVALDKEEITRRFSRFLLICSVGIVISGTVSLEFHSPSNKSYPSKQMQDQGIDIFYSSDAGTSIGKGIVDRLRGLPIKVRANIIKRLYDNSIDYRARKLILSLILGKRKAIPYSVQDAYQYIGIAHMLALSGLHLGIIALPLIWLTRFLPAGNGMRAIVVLSVLFAYIAIASFPPSLIRAYLLFATFTVSRQLGFQCSLFRCLLLSGMLALFICPSMITTVSYELSFLAVFGIATIALPMIRLMEKVIPRDLKGKIFSYFLFSVIVTVSVQLTTMPLALNTFSRVSAISIATNMIFIIPLTLFLYSGSLYTFIHVEPLVTLLSPLLNFLACILWNVPFRLAKKPSIGIMRKDIESLPYFMFLCFLVATFTFEGRKRWALLSVALCFLALSFMPHKMVKGIKDEDLVRECIPFCRSQYIHGMDSSILVVGEAGSFYEARKLVRCLWSMGVGRVQGIIVESADRRRYIDYIISRIGSKVFICSPYFTSNYPDLKERLEGLNVELHECKKGDRVRVGKLEIVISGPDFPPPDGILIDNRGSKLRFLFKVKG